MIAATAAAATRTRDHKQPTTDLERLPTKVRLFITNNRDLELPKWVISTRPNVFIR